MLVECKHIECNNTYVSKILQQRPYAPHDPLYAHKPAKHYSYCKQRTLTTVYGEIYSSKENSFPNPSITFGKVFCLSSKRWLHNFHFKVETTVKPSLADLSLN